MNGPGAHGHDHLETPMPNFLNLLSRRMFQGIWAAILYLIHALLYFTCRKEFIGRENYSGLRSVIFCGWHVGVVPFISAFWRFDRQMSYLAIDHWKTWPIHWLLRRMGIGPLVNLHSTRPVEQLVKHLQSGYSTVLTPDGPRGPAKTLREGVLRIAQQSGVPIIPVQVTAPIAWVWSWSWDRKRVPLPFSKLTVRYGEPIFVTADNFQEARASLLKALG